MKSKPYYLLLITLALLISSANAAEFVLQAPNGDEMLPAGMTYPIIWTPAGPTETVQIDFSSDKGVSWNTVATVPNTGSSDWLVPSVPSGLCLIRITDPINPTLQDTSDNLFRIYECQQAIVMDLNNDCYVDLADFVIFSQNWLLCANPYDISCPCPDSFTDCDGDPANGCESNLNTDTQNCGSCGNACTAANADTTCQDGECVIVACENGFYDCDGDYANGCEATVNDSYESNDTCAAASNLGTVSEPDPEQSWQAQILPEGDEDWYRFYAEQGSYVCIPYSAQEYQIRVRLVPPQGASCTDYNLYVYDDSCQLLDSSTAADCTEEVIYFNWAGTCNFDDSRYFRIRVTGAGSSDWHCDPYTLYIDMWQL